jgi:hypothetical protein
VDLNTYIVRVYRRKNGIPHSLVGVVEEVGKPEKKAFTSLDDLWDILKTGKKTQPSDRGSGEKHERV